MPAAHEDNVYGVNENTEIVVSDVDNAWSDLTFNITPAAPFTVDTTTEGVVKIGGLPQQSDVADDFLFTLQVSDGEESTSAIFTVDILNTNDQPEAQAVDSEVIEGGFASIELVATDPDWSLDGHPTENDQTAWRFTLSNPDQLPAVDGQYQISDVSFDGARARATLTFTHDGSEAQSHTIGYRFDDGSEDPRGASAISDTAFISLQVIGIDDPPCVSCNATTGQIPSGKMRTLSLKSIYKIRTPRQTMSFCPSLQPQRLAQSRSNLIPLRPIPNQRWANDMKSLLRQPPTHLSAERS